MEMVNPYDYYGLNNVWPRGFRFQFSFKSNANKSLNISRINKWKRQILIQFSFKQECRKKIKII